MASSSMVSLNWSTHQERNITCNECNKNIYRTGDIYRDRTDHYVRYTYAVHSCPVCLFILPTTCAIAAHLRLHLNIPPYICPQCGQDLPDSIMTYPFEHYCEGFNKMRANIRYTCKLGNCNKLNHPTEFIQHYKSHLFKVLQCTICSIIWSNDAQTRCRHYDDKKLIISIGFRCPICPNNLFADRNIEEHVNVHYDDLCKEWNIEIHPCRICNIVHPDIESLLNHHIIKHNAFNIRNILAKLLVMRDSGNPNNTDIFWLIKSCNKCLKSYTYQSTNNNMNILENICPYGCLENEESLIQCFICKMKISQKWENVKSHYAQYHNEHKCLDLKLELTRHDDMSFKTMNIQNVTGNIQNYLASTSQLNYEPVQIAEIPGLSGMEMQIFSPDDDLSVVEIDISSEENDESMRAADNSNVCCEMEIETQDSSDDTDEENDLIIVEDNNESVGTDDYLQMEPMEIQVISDDDDDDDDDLAVEESHVPSGENNELLQTPESSNQREVKSHDDPTKNDSLFSLQVNNNESVSASENLNVAQEQNDLQVNKVDEDPTVGGSKASIEQNNDVEQTEETPYKCKFCNTVWANKENLETHFITHRVTNMAYQCLDCGDCFSAQASFAIHLFIEHEIRKVQEYVDSKPCYNERARAKNSNSSFYQPNENFLENQCHVCRLQLDNSVDFGRHIRVHGLPYIMSLRRKRQVNQKLHK